MTNNNANSDIVEIKFNSTFAWLLIIFGGIFFCLGFAFMLPFAPAQNVPLGAGVVALSATGFAIGFWWKGHLPLQLRLTPEELQFRDKRPPIRWVEIERADLKKIHAKGEVGIACIKLTAEASKRLNADKSGVHKLAARLGGDYDLVLHEQQFDKTAEWLVTEFNRRIGLAVARQRGLTGGSVSQTTAAKEAAPGPAPVQFWSSQETGAPLWLGPLQAEYGVNVRGRNRSLLTGFVFLIVGGFAIAAPHLRPPKPGEERAVFAFLYILGGLSCLAGLVTLSWPLFRKRRTFAVHQEGLTVSEGGRSLYCRWKDIERLGQRSEKGAIRNCLVDVIHLSDGQKIEVDPNHVQNAAELMRSVGAAAGRFLAPPIARRLLAGETLTFGPLVLTAQAVQAGQFTCAWPSIQSVETGPDGRDIIVIYTMEGPLPFPFGMNSIPNLRLLTTVARLMKSRHDRSVPNR